MFTLPTPTSTWFLYLQAASGRPILNPADPEISEQRSPHRLSVISSRFIRQNHIVHSSISPGTKSHQLRICDMEMLHPKTLLDYPEDEPELVFASLPAGPKPRRRDGVGIRKLTIISIAEAGFEASTTFTPAFGVRIVPFCTQPRVTTLSPLVFLEAQVEPK